MKAARMLDSSADPPGPIGLNIELLASPARSILVAAIAAIAAMGHSATPLRLRKTRRHPTCDSDRGVRTQMPPFGTCFQSKVGPGYALQAATHGIVRRAICRPSVTVV